MPTIASATATSTCVKLSCKKTAGDCYYHILRSTNKDSGYEEVVQIAPVDGKMYAVDSSTFLKRPIFTDVTAEPGQTYYYKVRATRGWKWSAILESAPVKIRA